MRLEVHSLKGSAGYLGARQLTAACQVLEDRAAAEELEGAAERIASIESAYNEARQALVEATASP